MLVIENPELERKIERKAAEMGKTVEELLWIEMEKLEERERDSLVINHDLEKMPS